MTKEELKKLSAPELDKPIIKRGPRNASKTKLKALRVKAGLSQSELAGYAGLNLRSYQHYEQGSHPLHRAALDTLLKICLALNCRLTDIIDDPDTIKLIKKYKGMVNK